MKSFVILCSFLISLIASANTLPSITWVGQFPKEQASPIVELFNKEFANDFGFTVVYNSNDAAITSLLEGKVDPSFDVVHMKDADMLHTLTKMNLTEKLDSQVLGQVPSHLKDSNHAWTGILKRARIIYYNSDYVTADELKNYEDLGNPKFKDKLCLRQKKAQYNIGLYSFFLGVWGEEKTKNILKTWAHNSDALPVIEKDLDGVIVNIEKGQCWVGVANTYYFARHLRDNPQTKVKFVFPNQDDIGTHVNVDGIAILKSSQNKERAQVFANWLLTEKPQMELSKITDKFPVHPATISASLDSTFGSFKENTTFNLNWITDHKVRALEIATEQGLK